MKKTMHSTKSSSVFILAPMTIKGSEETDPCSVSVSSRGKYSNVTMSIAIFISSHMLLLAEVLLIHKRILKHDWILDF